MKKKNMTAKNNWRKCLCFHLRVNDGKKQMNEIEWKFNFSQKMGASIWCSKYNGVIDCCVIVDVFFYVAQKRNKLQNAERSSWISKNASHRMKPLFSSWWHRYKDMGKQQKHHATLRTLKNLKQHINSCTPVENSLVQVVKKERKKSRNLKQ